MNSLKSTVLTIGHSTHSTEDFVVLLHRHSVDVIGDVRSAPYSRFNPQFNKDVLEQAMKTHGIRYVFLGHGLGARPDDPSCYRDGRLQFDLLASTQAFRRGIDRILHGAGDYRIALMCAEKEPLDCHRTLLVSHVLAASGVSVEHILADGRPEPHELTMERLLDRTGRHRQDLFRSKEDMIAEAIAAQEQRIAYANAALSEGRSRDSV